MLDERLTKGCASLREEIGVCDGPLRECYAAHAVGNARDVQHFEDQIDAMVRLPKKPTLAVAKFYLTGRHRASGDLVLEAAYLIVQLAVLTAARYQVQTQPTHTLRGALAPRRDHRQLRTGIAGEVLVPGEPPFAPILSRNGLDRRAQVRPTLDLRHPGCALPDAF